MGPGPSRSDSPVRWATVASFADDATAHLLAGRLEAEGIETWVFPDTLSDPYGRGAAALWGKLIEVRVPEHRVLEAQEIIRKIEAS